VKTLKISKQKLDLLIYYFIVLVILLDSTTKASIFTLKILSIGTVLILYLIYFKYKPNILLLISVFFAMMSSINYAQFYKPDGLFVGTIIFSSIYFYVFILVLLFIDKIDKNIDFRKHLTITVVLYYLSLFSDYLFMDFALYIDTYRYLIAKSQLGITLVVFLFMSEKNKKLFLVYLILLAIYFYSFSQYQIRSNAFTVIILVSMIIFFSFVKKPFNTSVKIILFLLLCSIIYLYYDNYFDELFRKVEKRFMYMFDEQHNYMEQSNRSIRYQELIEQLRLSYIPYLLGNGIGMSAYLSKATDLNSPHSAILGMFHEIGVSGGIFFILYYLKHVFLAYISKNREVKYAGMTILSLFMLSMTHSFLFPNMGGNYIIFEYLILYLLLIPLIKYNKMNLHK